MKIYIDYKFTSNPWGGGNQFLKALRKELIKFKKYTDFIKNANTIIVNSHHFSFKLFLYYLIKSELKIIHRIDGPISLTRNEKFSNIDKLIYSFSKHFSDGVIFQSKWSKNKNYKLGFKNKIRNIVINNAPDKNIFKKQINLKKNLKIKIISSSWSSNIKKGFKYLKYLDENLNFNKFEITFIGNSPYKFKNIKVSKAVKSKTLARILNKNNFFLTASQNDPCSNSLLEALHCGLYPIYLSSGGHNELVKNQGIKFINKKDLLNKIKSIKKSKNYSINKNLLVDISKVKNKYLNFIKRTSIDKPNFIFRFYNIVKFIFNLYLVKITNWLI